MSWEVSVVTSIAFIGFFFLALYVLKKKENEEEIRPEDLDYSMRDLETNLYLVFSLGCFWFLSGIIKSIVIVNNAGRLDPIIIYITNFNLVFGLVLVVYILLLIIKLASMIKSKVDEVTSEW